MIDKRQFLITIAAAATTGLAGCNGDNNTNNTDDNAQNNSGEFSINQFLVEGQQPQNYEAEFISGLEPGEFADQLTPQIQYQLQTPSQVETEFQLEYTDETIPQEEPLDETINGETHNSSGEYTQNTPIPQELAAEVLKNPKNIKTTFKATDTETGETTTEEYEINLADSYVEQIQREVFNKKQFEISDAQLKSINVEDNTIIIDFKSDHEVGSQKMEYEIAGIIGLYSSNVERTRVPYQLDLSVQGSKGEVYNKSFGKQGAEAYLNGEDSRRGFKRDMILNQLWEDLE